MYRTPPEDKANLYIREKIRQARQEADETQDDLARVLEKNRVAVSDLERGRVSVNAADLYNIAAYFGKPISYYFPPNVSIDKEELSPFDQELLFLISQLPDTQQTIALEYVRQKHKAVEAARGRKLAEEVAKLNKK